MVGIELSHVEKAKLIQHKRGDFAKALLVEMIRARRYDRSLSLSIIAVEVNKDVHEETWRYQRPAVFGAISQCASDTLRVPDFFAKVSSTYFGVALPETPAMDAPIPMDRIVNSPALAEALSRTRRVVERVVYTTTSLSARDVSASAFIDRAISEMEASSFEGAA